MNITYVAGSTDPNHEYYNVPSDIGRSSKVHGGGGGEHFRL